MKVNINWNLCRVCLTEIESLEENKNIFELDEDKVEIANKISECGGIEIHKDGNLPETICKLCMKHLNIAYKFRTTCKITNERLQTFVNKANNFLLTEALEMTESLGVPEIEVDESLAEKQLDLETNADLVEYIIEDSADIESQHNMFAKENHEFLDNNSINFVTFIKDSESDKEIADAKYLIKETVSDKSNLDIDRNVLPSFKIEDDNLELEEEKILESNDGYFEFHTSENEINEPVITKRKYTKRNESKSFSCGICGNKFKHKYSLDVHMRLHTNEKPFVCEICNKDFALNFQLSRHMRIHTGEKPYSCQFCERKFRDISTKIKHERIHTNERPFKCPHCPKDFIYSDVCKRHIATHTGERPYECLQCNKKFAQSYHLKAHLMTLSHKAISEQNEQNGTQSYNSGIVYVTSLGTPINENTTNLIEPHQVISLN